MGTNLAASEKSVNLASRYSNIYASVGIHPHDAAKVSGQTWLALEALAASPKVVAIGETGLDYYRNKARTKTSSASSVNIFPLAKSRNLPVIIHCREASSDCLKILNTYKNGALKGVVHCFSGTEEVAKACLELGLHISLRGPGLPFRMGLICGW